MTQAALEQLSYGSRVAVVTMTGTCCPITLAHIQAFVESRRLLLSHGYDAVLGGLSLNGDSYVSNKLGEKGLPSISKRDRSYLVKLAMQEHPWLQYNSNDWYSKNGESGEAAFCTWHQQTLPQLQFVHYWLNGADDVLRRQKWKWKGVRQIVMCRPGATADLLSQLRKAGIDENDGTFIVGPELADISSTEVRNALANGDKNLLLQLVHPAVAHWCWDKGPYRPPLGSAWEEEVPRTAMGASAQESQAAAAPTLDAPVRRERREAARAIYQFVSGVLNTAWDSDQIAEKLISIKCDIALWSNMTPSFISACDALADAIDEGLVPSIALLNLLAHRLPDHGVSASAKLPQTLRSTDCSDIITGDGTEKRWQKSAGSTLNAPQLVPAPVAFLDDVARLCTVGTAGEDVQRSNKAQGSGGAKGVRAAIARETLSILIQGCYVAPGSQKSVDISSTLCQAVVSSMHVPSAGWQETIAKASGQAKACQRKQQKHSIEVRCCTVLAAAQDLAWSESSIAPPGVLNFASARNPGGGFTTGAEAQEESLARSSGIYPCLSKYFDAFFMPNRRASSGLYTHDLIHSPAVPVIRDAHGILLDEPYLVDFVTAAAPNCGVLESRGDAKQAARRCREALHERISRVLQTFASNGCVDLVLGAWGCGVFRNDPATVAQLFNEALAKLGCFRRVIFAVLDPSMAQTFGDEFHVAVEGLTEKGSGFQRHHDQGQSFGNNDHTSKGKSKGIPKGKGASKKH